MYKILILAWVSIHTPNKVWGEIIYLFANVNSCIQRVYVWEWICNYIYDLCNYLYYIHTGLILIRVSVIWSYAIYQNVWMRFRDMSRRVIDAKWRCGNRFNDWQHDISMLCCPCQTETQNRQFWLKPLSEPILTKIDNVLFSHRWNCVNW